ncbi:MAG TPA: hypothetical protein VHO28_14450, partial [Ignavibacteriales bacterium]|nr:hypothetical protein [Ignavibacteriales bacterium]
MPIVIRIAPPLSSRKVPIVRPLPNELVPTITALSLSCSAPETQFYKYASKIIADKSLLDNKK